MKVVILHDWLTGFRGGERVLETLCQMYPEAPIYTLIHKKGSTSPTIESRVIVTSFLNKVPGIHKHYRKFLPLMPLAVECMKITHDVDLVISSSHCVIKGIKKPKGSKHISYIHSPMRYMYDQYDNYFRKSPLYIKIAAYLSRPYLQWWDKNNNKNIDQIIANSNFVKSRITKYYNQDSKVIHPFVDLEDFKKFKPNDSNKEDYYLMVTAFAPNKRLDIAIKAFNKIGKKLKIIGCASDKELAHFKSMSEDNIEFLGSLSREEVVKHMHMAKAFIFPGVEDFGITPLEAMASGTPVIAFKAGGVLETLTPDTSTFFDSPTPESLIAAFHQFTNSEFSDEMMRDRSEDFSKEVFINNIKQCVQEVT